MIGKLIFLSMAIMASFLVVDVRADDFDEELQSLESEVAPATVEPEVGQTEETQPEPGRPKIVEKQLEKKIPPPPVKKKIKDKKEKHTQKKRKAKKQNKHKKVKNKNSQ